jgi:hypothetical protein
MSDGYVRELVESKVIDTRWISSRDNPADIFTKGIWTFLDWGPKATWAQRCSRRRHESFCSFITANISPP